MLAVGRALMSRPRLLILDEPSLGLGPIIVDNLFKILTEINAQGVTILLVEQNAVMALDLANRAYVLETGRVTISGTSNELVSIEKVRSAYLGGG
jgi:branched-chain amino acid transport system ATP-binding protein